MKVMGALPGASCLACGCQTMNLGWPDRITGDFSVACMTPGCDRKGIAVRLTAPIVEAPVVYPEWQ